MTTIYEHRYRGVHDMKELVPGEDYEHAILGKCHGVLLRWRGKDDNHVCITHLVEDDELWHCGSQSSGFSSFWLDDHQMVMARAQQWIQENCDKDPSGFGYVFRSTK